MFKMSNKLKKLLKKKEKTFNELYEMNKLTSQNNEINYENTSDDNNNIINQENNNTDENNQITTENKIDNDTDLKEEEEIENDINNEQKSEDEEESQETEEELPLITLNFISVCQCCKNKFDKRNHIPYLLKCGHFFCLNCINQYFTDKTGIVCPSDGPVAKSINDLKLLKYLIFNSKSKTKKDSKNKMQIPKNNDYEKIDYYNYMKRNLKNYDSDINNNINTRNNKCHIHKNQKLTHIICDTNEIICVNCAFEMLKLNPTLQIKELKEKYNELSDFIDNIMNKSQKNIDLIQNTIDLIKKNKENEMKKVKLFYNSLIKFLENEKKTKMQKIESISKDNLNNLEQKLLIFNEIIEQGEEFQNNLDKDDININQNYSSVINNYNNILKLNQSNNSDHSNNKLKYIKFINKNASQVKEYINKIANINVVNRIIKYNKKINSRDNNNENIKLLKDYSSKTNEASSMRYIKRIVKKHPNNKNISSDNLFNNRSQNDSSEYYTNFNNSVKGKTSLYSNKNQYDNHTYELNKKKNMSKTIKTPQVNNQFQQKFINLGIKSNNRSLLENYFDMKNNKDIKDNFNYNNYNEVNNVYFNDNTESIKNRKSNKSVNNLNILNNFYNLDYSRKSPSNNNSKTRKYVNAEQIKLYKDSLNKLIPKQLKQINFE